jgi:hypothetical protein
VIGTGVVGAEVDPTGVVGAGVIGTGVVGAGVVPTGMVGAGVIGTGVVRAGVIGTGVVRVIILVFLCCNPDGFNCQSFARSHVCYLNLVFSVACVSASATSLSVWPPVSGLPLSDSQSDTYQMRHCWDCRSRAAYCSRPVPS